MTPTLYPYRCPHCSQRWTGYATVGTVTSCPGCGRRWKVIGPGLLGVWIGECVTVTRDSVTTGANDAKR